MIFGSGLRRVSRSVLAVFYSELPEEQKMTIEMTTMIREQLLSNLGRLRLLGLSE